MAFTRTGIAANSPVLSSHSLQIIQALEGDAGAGQPIALVALNSSSSYALDVRNLDAGSKALRVRNAAGTTLLDSAAGGLTLTTPTVSQLTISTAASKIIPGATSLSLRNNAESADNLLISDAGVATVRVAFAGPGTVASAGDLRLANNAKVTWRNAANSADLAGLGYDNSNRLTIDSVSTSGSATAGANGAPPAQVASYLVVMIGGVQQKIPYYNT